MRYAAVLVAAAVLGGCGGQETITIELLEVNGSGITGVVELRPAGAGATRITVTRVDGGSITGARVETQSPCPDVNDKYPIRPPTGIANREFEFFQHAAERGELTAAFLRNGRYVACGWA